MSETFDRLIQRCEQHAAKISGLEAEVDRLQTLLDARGPATERAVVESMARTTVNCGQDSSCYLARRHLENLEDQEGGAG